MRIGTVAEKYQVSIATIRYYINLGLLVPLLKGKQYDFDQQSIEELELILQLKALYFSINDIQTIVTLKRISNFKDCRDREALFEHMLQHRNRLSEIHQQTQSILDNLNQELHKIEQHLPEFGLSKSTCSGIPFAFIPYLCCPKCGSSLKLENATMENQQIISGKFYCDCGYHMPIKNGILITPLKSSAPGDIADLERKYYNCLLPSLMTLFKKSYTWLSNQLETLSKGNKLIMETHINSYFFLFTNFEALSPDNLYILVDNHPEILQMYKEIIENMGLKLNILYLACNTLEYPLRKHCVDVYIDFYATNEYATFDKGWLYSLSKRYFNKNHDYLGTYFYFPQNSSSRGLLLQKYPLGDQENFNKQSFLSNIHKENLQSCSQIEIGSVGDSGGSMSFHVPPERLSIYSFHYKNPK